MNTVVVADYGIGNLLSVERALTAVGSTVVRTNDGEIIRRAERLVVPGVGAFGDCMDALKRYGLVDPILEAVRSGRPVLGICVGMQMLMERSEEFGEHSGLGIIKGKVSRIASQDDDGRRLKIPHIGWNDLSIPAGQPGTAWSGTVLENLAEGSAVYFVHSYNCEPLSPSHRLADAHYGGQVISAAVRHENVTGTQFHPEKSGPVGLAVLRSFAAE